ncbi:MAG: hypothetical protein HC799_12065 [Limnothrix sp. RL_2_0]|nr:hypothetical protein [Limnothrix sp. RL_2_0]
MKKTLAIATFSFLFLSIAIPHSTAFGQEVLNFEIENQSPPAPQLAQPAIQHPQQNSRTSPPPSIKKSPQPRQIPPTGTTKA